uniref:uncharacterized protein n=1 Tax=Myxine glutinosa TaxID=7769 RepID=UPI00358FE7A7
MNELDDGPVVVSESSGEPSRKRMLRSSDANSSQRDWSRRHMFPEECIFCHSNQYKRSHISGKRSMVRLVKCELISGGQLLKAAKAKEDVQMLHQIEGEDLVARELQYHHGCYKNYTRFLSKPGKPLTPVQNGYIDAFDKFSQNTIRKRLIIGKEILTLSKLNKIFIRAIKDVSGIDAPYRTWHLKTRLQKSFPQLVFIKAKSRNMSDIVFSECLSAEDLAEDLVDDTARSLTDDSTDNEEESIPTVSESKVPPTNDDLRMLYSAALIIKAAVSNKPSSPPPWPPTSDDLTEDKVKAEVPFQLFNLT